MDHLEARIDRLERTNRRLFALWGVTLASAALMGAQTVATEGVLRARRFELVDTRGVPLATLAPTRGGQGGELILRDRAGERRAALTVEPGSASMSLQGGKVDDPSGTAGLRADEEGATMGLVGARASLSATVRKDRPRIATTDAKGRETFVAPWR